MTQKKFIKICIAKSYDLAIDALRADVAAYVLEGGSAAQFFQTAAFERWIKTLFITGESELLLEFSRLGWRLNSEQATALVHGDAVERLTLGLPETELPLIAQYINSCNPAYDSEKLFKIITDRLLLYTPDPKSDIEVRTVALGSVLVENPSRSNHLAWLQTVAKQKEIITRVVAMQPLLLAELPLEFQQRHGDYILERHLLNLLLSGQELDLTEPGVKLLLECGSVLSEKLKTVRTTCKSNLEFSRKMWVQAVAAYANDESIWLAADFGINGLTAMAKAFRFSYKDLSAKTISDLLNKQDYLRVNLLVALEYPLDIEQTLRLIERCSEQDSWYYLIQHHYKEHHAQVNAALFLHDRMATIEKLIKTGQFIVNSSTLLPLIKYFYKYPIGFIPEQSPKLRLVSSLAYDCKLKLLKASLTSDNISLAHVLVRQIHSIPLDLATKALLLEETQLFKEMIPKLSTDNLARLKKAARLQGHKESFA